MARQTLSRAPFCTAGLQPGALFPCNPAWLIGSPRLRKALHIVTVQVAGNQGSWAASAVSALVMGCWFLRAVLR
jgi:hypothetical protein